MLKDQSSGTHRPVHQCDLLHCSRPFLVVHSEVLPGVRLGCTRATPEKQLVSPILTLQAHCLRALSGVLRPCQTSVVTTETPSAQGMALTSSPLSQGPLRNAHKAWPNSGWVF